MIQNPTDALRLVPTGPFDGYEHSQLRSAVGMAAFRVVRNLDKRHGHLSGGFRDHDDLEAGDEILAALAAAPASPLPEGGGWKDIITAPDSDHPTFVVQAFEVRTAGGVIYTSDPVCVWRNLDGSFARWKQDFAPTHWMPLPAAPTGAK